MRNITSRSLLIIKAALFTLLAITIWAFARERYIDSSYKFAGLRSAIAFTGSVWRRRPRRRDVQSHDGV